MRATIKGRAPRLALLALLCASACAVRLIAEYDEHAVQEASRLQKEMDLFLTRLGSQGGAFPARAAFYDTYETDVRALRLRAEARPKNQITAEQLGKIEKSVGDLREVHRAGPVSDGAARVNRDLFNAMWKAVLTLELAKKRE